MDKRHFIQRCQSGDREAFGILYQTYLTPMYEIVAYYVHNHDAVWDILHDGFLIAFASIDSLKNAEKVEAWLTSIMKNLSLQYLKDEASHISVPMSDTAIADNISEPIDEGRELTWAELDKIIEKLPKGYGKVFRLAVLDGLSHKEIAALLGIAPHSSSSQLTHAKAMLRRMITQYRMEMGLLSIIGIIMLIWHWAINRSRRWRVRVASTGGRDTGVVSDKSPQLYITLKLSVATKGYRSHKVLSTQASLPLA